MNIENLSIRIIEFISSPVINFAIQQNRNPIVRKLVIENISESDLSDISIGIKFEPEFANNWNQRIDFLPKGQKIELEIIDIHISAKYLSELTEKIIGDITLIIRKNESILFQKSYTIELFAYDQWNGIGTLPEMLVAFITPNHPEIKTIIRNASLNLQRWTGNPSFDGYQSSNPDRVKKQMAAIFEAIAQLEIVYCSPPASFENEGQRIRMCDTIFSQKIATCLDIAIFYASCIEAIGLHPLIIIIKNHAFVGAWLIDETFPDTVNDDDVSLLKKRTANGINEICLIEATCMNKGSTDTFDKAMHDANHKLVKEDDFILFIDVKKARLSGITPLPQRIKTLDGWKIEEAENTSRISDAPENIITENITTNDYSRVATKQELWERKLLDLSLRNNLLNLKVTKSKIQLIPISLTTLIKTLADGEEFQILSKPDEWINPLNVAGVYQSINLSDPIVDYLKHELKQKRLCSYLNADELGKSLTTLYRAARLSLEENGANTLYLAVGLLKWYETNTSELARYAPILLLPIEIIRKSAQRGYVIRSRDEETLINITLMEMLRHEFDITINGIDELAKDGNNIDINKIFNTIRKGISKPRWDVEEQAFLGTFSFNKFVMWNDIHNNAEKLQQNKIIASLISGKLEWEINENSYVDDFDKRYHPKDNTLPISADSTQYEAICAARQGKSFIIHGPPGTGKSQTITNIIANSLYHDKRVLFVAEKMAALSVVHKRLTAIGLDPFCLELHSNKSNKSSVLEQLKKRIDLIQKSSPLEYEEESERLFILRTELNDYVEALHKQYFFGFSLYDSLTRYAQYHESPDCINFEEPLIEKLTSEKLRNWCELIKELQEAGTLCGNPHKHSLSKITTKKYIQIDKIKTLQLISRYIEQLTQLKKNRKSLCDILKINNPLFKREQNVAAKHISMLIKSLPETPSEIMNSSNVESILGEIIDLAHHGVQRDNYREELCKDFNENILRFDADVCLEAWDSASEKWIILRWLEQNKIIKKLKSYSKTGKVKNDIVVNYLETIILYKKNQTILDEHAAMLIKSLDFLWKGGNIDWANVICICESVIQIHQSTLVLTEDIINAKQIRNNLTVQMSEGHRAFLDFYGKTLECFIENSNQLEETEDRLSELLGIDFESENNNSQDWIELWGEHASNWHNNFDLLRNWTSWNLVKGKAIDAGLEPVVDSYIKGELKNEEVLSSFKKTIYRICSDYVISKDPRLSDFNGKLFENKIKKFKEKNKYFEDLTKAQISSKLSSKITSFQEVNQTSEPGKLKKAILNKGRGMSVRKLFDSIPTLLPKICPCMLMSPISVAQYFDASTSKFDLVIFDEASQMPTCEAVGAIVRAKNVIVVGDPQQMPPTNFFSTNNYDEANPNEDYIESILDDCIALSIPSKHLRWHYRSKHESLIAFSNSNFYENKLYTFPSPDDLVSKVQYINVPGFYDRGKTRQNHNEAKAIVKEVIHRLSDKDLLKKSIGIVTFSSVQQNLIDDLLNEEFRKHPELEEFAKESAEPIFIKNLENVQGDERDIILFSMGYGPDKDGKVSLNFGPLNKDGGSRRLNVAVSRARYEMIVYSTLRSDQIDITRSNSEGVAKIKAFLEYAEKGKAVLTQKNYIHKMKSHSLENFIAEEIKKHGFIANTDIGCSGYRIDIGIINPENPSEYILGILTDGENYKSARTANEREIVQMEVLKMLGWNIYKLWSPDWWDNSKNVIQDIILAIKDAQNLKLVEVVSDSITENNPDDTSVEIDYDIHHEITQHEIKPINIFIKYKECKLNVSKIYDSNDFFLTNNESIIISQINQVMQAEAPISETLLSKRILTAWGITRSGVRLNTYLEELLSKLKFKYTIQDGTKFYWNHEQNSETFDIFRIPSDDEYKRNAEDIPKEEIARGVVEILTNQMSLPYDELIIETARLFGYARLGATVDLSMRFGVDYALKNKLICKINDRIVLPVN